MSKKNKPKKLGRRARKRQEQEVPLNQESGYKWYWFVPLLVISIMVISLMSRDQSSKEGVVSPSQGQAASTGVEKPLLETSQSLRGVVMEYQRLHPGEDDWWITGVESSEEFLQITERFRAKFGALMLKYKDVSPLAQEIYNALGKNFLLSKFSGGISAQIMTAEQARVIESDPRGLSRFWELCIVPQTEYRPRAFPSSLYYRKDWQAVMMAGVKRSEVWDAALLYHEIGHALRHRVQKAPSATAPANSDSFIWEEMEMHELEHKILNVGSQGKFEDLLDSIIDRVEVSASNGVKGGYKKVCASVTLQDMQAYDRLFGIQSAGTITTPVHVSQFLLSLGIRLVNRTIPEGVEARKMAKIVIYRALAGK